MQIYNSLSEYRGSALSSVTIGKFDGLHQGHRELIKRTVDGGKELRARDPGAVSIVLVMHQGCRMLLTDAERRQMLADLGVDILIEQRPTPLFRSTPAEAFIRDGLCGQLHAAIVSVGRDFRFGFKRSGNREMLVKAGESCGYRTELVPPVMKDGQRISSTRVREAIAASRMEQAAELLGYPYFFSGSVMHGKELGRKLGFPTANILPDDSKLLPPFGVYYSLTHLEDVTVAGMTNVGMNPTVQDGDVRIETHLFDFDGDIYGQDAKVELLHFARPERTFDGVESLKNQLFRDREAGKEFFTAQSKND